MWLLPAATHKWSKMHINATACRRAFSLLSSNVEGNFDIAERNTVSTFQRTVQGPAFTWILVQNLDFSFKVAWFSPGKNVDLRIIEGNRLLTTQPHQLRKAFNSLDTKWKRWKKCGIQSIRVWTRIWWIGMMGQGKSSTCKAIDRWKSKGCPLGKIASPAHC